MYLKRNITGQASGIEYGKQGDKISVLSDTGEMWLVENKGTRFFVFPDDLDLNKPVKNNANGNLERDKRV